MSNKPKHKKTTLNLDIKIEKSIIDHLKQKSPYPADELINDLKNKNNISDVIIRQILWRLISDMKIDFTEDRKLRIAA